MQNKSSPGSQKKLKQLRLPFQVISKTLADDKKETSEVRKRRPSEPSDDSRAAKIGKIDQLKENLNDPIEIIPDDDNLEASLSTAADNESPESTNPSETDQPSTTIKRDKLVKNPKSTKKRKLKVIDTYHDAAVEEPAVLMIKLPTSTKKRNKKRAKSVENTVSKSTALYVNPESSDLPEMVENSDICEKVSNIEESIIEGAQKAEADCAASNVHTGPANADTYAKYEVLKTVVQPEQIESNNTNEVTEENSKTDESSKKLLTSTMLESKEHLDEISLTANKENETFTEINLLSLDQVLTSPGKDNTNIAEENTFENNDTEKSTDNEAAEHDKNNIEEKNDDAPLLNNSLCSSSLDEKSEVVGGTETTNHKLTKKTGECKTPTSANKTANNTPKQTQRKKEQDQRNLEKQLAKEERDRKLMEEKEQRLEKELQRKKEREEKEEQKRKEREDREEQKRKERKNRDEKLEQQRKEREEKEEQKRLEREEKETKRLAEIEQKNEERKQKEEEKKKKELETEMKKKRASEAFTKFFVAKKTDPRNISEDDSSSCEVLTSEGRLAFMPFQKKENMQIAPLVRRNLSSKVKAELEKLLLDNDVDKKYLYIDSLKKGEHVPRKSEKSWHEDDDDVIIVISKLIDILILSNILSLKFFIDEMDSLTTGSNESTYRTTKKTYRAKYLKFEENQRPAYYGTWRKKSGSITGRKPFALDDVSS
jgi:chromatin assembly factor 1 subunit A